MSYLTKKQNSVKIFLNSLTQIWVVEVYNNNPHNYSIHQTNNQSNNLDIYHSLNPGMKDDDWDIVNCDFKHFLIEITGINEDELDIYEEVEKIIKNNL